MIEFANCKINIGLDIINRRDDGYHNISTIMYPVLGLSDIVEVVYSDEFRFTSSGLAVDCSDDDNLCVKAYNLIKREYSDVPPLHIHLHKVVPFGAGLGSGSSDAVAVMKCINSLLNLSISTQKMKEFAAELGSDTIFFVDNRAQLCLSRGEITSPIEVSLRGKYITIVKPPISISTREAYSGVALMEPKFDLSKIATIDISEWKENVKNSFETNLFSKYSALEAIKNKFYDLGAIYSSMSGSGSALFAISEQPIDRKSFDDNYFFCSYLEK